jgi:hypothetical protein
VAAGLALGVGLSLAPTAVSRGAPSAPSFAPTIAAASAPAVRATAALAPAFVRPLALPPSVVDADLSVMPDRYVNESPPASFRIVVSVRGGIPALASVDPPATITWTEGGLSYRLTSPARTVSQLLDIAGALR